MLRNLNVIHIAGTKGKGSTVAFARALLQAYRERTGLALKIGCYTSPHLQRVEERIQLDRPISQSRFAELLFEVYDRVVGQTPQDPRYLQFLMLMSIHAFIKERVDVAIYETHSGGEYDATNVFTNPVATGISTIGIDHVEQLGPTIENIAWHKSGIFKAGVPAFSVPQIPSVANVLKDRAVEKTVSMKVIDTSTLDIDSQALQPAIQKTNLSLALALANVFLMKKTHDSLTLQDIRRGIELFSWPGRFQIIIQGKHQWYLDGAHNVISLEQAANWFAEAINRGAHGDERTRIVVFSHLSTRDGPKLVRHLAESLKKSGMQIQHVIFSTYSRKPGSTHGKLVMSSNS